MFASLMQHRLTAVLLAFFATAMVGAPARAQYPQYQWATPQQQIAPAPRRSGPALPKPPPTTPGGNQASVAPSVPPPQEQPAPYDRDLQRLSEILGALHFLRGLCNSNEGQKWRTEAQALIEAEAPTGARHDQMIASFNRGYRGFQQSYHSCTPAAGLVIHRYLQEGAKIARDITARYAN